MKLVYKFETWYKDNISHTNHYRPFDKFIKQYFKDKKIMGAEIGVLNGCHSDCLLRNVKNIEKMFLIDPYKNYPGYDTEYSRYGLVNHFNDAHKRLSWADGRAVFVRKKFQDAVDYVPGGLDFVYYDIGKPDESVFLKQFFNLYFPLVKVGGVIGGYNFDANHLDVPCVVMDFAERNGLSLNGVDKDWWIVKK